MHKLPTPGNPMKTAENLEWRVNKIVTLELCTWVSNIQNHIIPQLHHPLTPYPRNLFILKIQLKKWGHK